MRLIIRWASSTLEILILIQVREPRWALVSVSIKLLTVIEILMLLIGLSRARAKQRLASYPLAFAPTV